MSGKGNGKKSKANQGVTKHFVKVAVKAIPPVNKHLPPTPTGAKSNSKKLARITLTGVILNDQSSVAAFSWARLTNLVQTKIINHDTMTSHDSSLTHHDAAVWVIAIFKETEKHAPAKFVLDSTVLCGTNGAKVTQHWSTFLNSFAAFLIRIACVGCQRKLTEVSTLADFETDAIYNDFILPLVNILMENCNMHNKLDVTSMFKANASNFGKALLSKASRSGMWSNEYFHHYDVDDNEDDTMTCRSTTSNLH